MKHTEYDLQNMLSMTSKTQAYEYTMDMIMSSKITFLHMQPSIQLSFWMTVFNCTWHFYRPSLGGGWHADKCFCCCCWLKVLSIGTLVEYCHTSLETKKGVVIKHFTDKHQTLVVDLHSRKRYTVSDRLCARVCEERWGQWWGCWVNMFLFSSIGEPFF